MKLSDKYIVYIYKYNLENDKYNIIKNMTKIIKTNDKVGTFAPTSGKLLRSRNFFN